MHLGSGPVRKNASESRITASRVNSDSISTTFCYEIPDQVTSATAAHSGRSARNNSFSEF
jgi:hypothetical protein